MTIDQMTAIQASLAKQIEALQAEINAMVSFSSRRPD